MGGMCILCYVCVRDGVGEDRGGRERERADFVHVCG